MFAKGYIQTEEHQEKAKTARRSKHKKKECISCGRKFSPYVEHQETCGQNECMASATIIRYHRLKETDPILHKAKAISGSIRLGKGKSDVVKRMLEEALGLPCEYCGEEITLLNASMDHKEPRNNKKVTRKKGEDGSYTDKEIRELDRRENLHIVCRKCNGTKGNFSHEEYLVLLDVFSKYPDIQKKMTKRFNIANLHFGR